jgi:ADP-ribose pyrophosphatase YjhB (NUDIX family)
MSFNIHICTFIVNAKKEILLIKEADNKNYGKYSLPSSQLKPHEALFECAKRALKETLGLTAGLDSLLGIYIEHSEEHTLHLIFYVSYLYGQIVPDKKIILDYHWAEEKELLIMSDNELANPKKVRKALNDYRRGTKIPLNVITEMIKNET